MLDRLRALAVFAKTAELGSFRAAARALSLSPSVVSHHVSALEAHLSQPLIYRSTRRLALTPSGERLCAAAQEMLTAATRGLDAVTGHGESPTGSLRITAPAFLAETRFSRDLAAFAAAHPGVALTVSFTEARHDLLRDGFDLALRIGGLKDSTLKTRKLAEMRRILVGSPRYVRTQATPRTLRDLAHWDFVQLSSRPAELSMTGPGKKTAATLTLHPRLHVDSAAALRELVIAGAGVTALPEVVVRADLLRARLVEVLPGWRPSLLGVYAVWPGGAQRPGLTLRFIEFLAPRIAALFAAAEQSPATRPATVSAKTVPVRAGTVRKSAGRIPKKIRTIAD